MILYEYWRRDGSILKIMGYGEIPRDEFLKYSRSFTKLEPYSLIVETWVDKDIPDLDGNFARIFCRCEESNPGAEVVTVGYF